MSNDKKLAQKTIAAMAEAERIDLAKRLGAENVDDLDKKAQVEFIFNNQHLLDEEIATAEEGATVEPVVMRGKKYRHFSGKKRKIVVSESGKEGDPNYVYVGINGEYEAQIPRGVECVVPEEVVHVLQNLAVETHIVDAGVDPVTKRPIQKKKQVNRFALQMNEPVED